MSGLAGRRVLVTRPRAQSEALARRIGEAGGVALCVPAIEIRPLDDPAPAQALLRRLAGFDLAIFVSGNAVRSAFALMGAMRWPAGLRAATVGQGSREELERHGVAGVIAPAAQSDSEALLGLPELREVRGRRIVIFRGDGGRQLLGEELGRRGAQVEYAACYRRVRPDGGAALRDAWAGGVDAVTVSSAEGLANFVAMQDAEASRRLAQLPVFVPHARVAAEAARHALGRVVVAGPRDAEMVAALVAYFAAAG